ncbi:MAG: MCE family protein [Alloprevotella sp.]|nr:MCE family protein [Alloprevotella sp.]
MKAVSKEVKIALTAIIAIALLYLLINFMKGVNVFKPANTYYVEFADIQGLAASSSVYANGYPVGIVHSIDYDYKDKNSVRVCIDLDEQMTMPVGTRAELQSSLMGGVTLHLLLGPNPAKCLERGATIKGDMQHGVLDEVGQLIPTVAAILPKVDSIMANLNSLTSDPALRTILLNFATTSQHLNTTSQQLEAMMGKDVPMMLTNLKQTSQNVEKLSAKLADVEVQPSIDEINTILKQAEASMAEVQAFSKNINKLSTDLNAKLNSRDNSIGLLLNDRELYDNLNRTTSELTTTTQCLTRAVQSGDSLLTDIKAHPKRYVHFSVFGKKDK